MLNNSAGLTRQEHPRLMVTNSPVHLWFRCVDLEIRGFFTVESLRDFPSFNQPTGIICYNKQYYIMELSTIQILYMGQKHLNNDSNCLQMENQSIIKPGMVVVILSLM